MKAIVFSSKTDNYSEVGTRPFALNVRKVPHEADTGLASEKA